jgi:hypothetical protein
MKNKNKIANIDYVMGELSAETEIYSVIEEKEEQFSTINNINFSFNLEQEKVEFLRNFVYFKRSLSPEFFHYNNSHALREGINLLQNENQNLKNRPTIAKVPTRVGSRGNLNGIVKLKTSYSISEADRNFMYNYIYDKQNSNPDFSKTEFMEDIINILSSTYPTMKKATK